jgi:hypothetical protein
MVMMVVGWLWVLVWVKRRGKKAGVHRNKTLNHRLDILYISFDFFSE